MVTYLFLVQSLPNLVAMLTDNKSGSSSVTSQIAIETQKLWLFDFEKSIIKYCQLSTLVIFNAANT